MSGTPNFIIIPLKEDEQKLDFIFSQCEFLLCGQLERQNVRSAYSITHNATVGFRLVGVVVMAWARERLTRGAISACAGIFFPGRVTPVTKKMTPGVIGSAMGLAGPVSAY